MERQTWSFSLISSVSIGILLIGNAVAPLRAQTDCVALARVGWFDTERVVTEEQRLRNFVEYVRSNEVQHYEDAKNLGATLGVLTSNVFINLGFSNDEQGLQDLKRSDEHSVHERLVEATRTHHYISRANSEVVSLVHDCLNQPGVHAVASWLDNPREPVITLIFRPDVGPGLASISLDPGTSVTCTTTSVELSQQHQLSQSVRCERPERAPSAKVLVNVKDAANRTGGFVWLPPVAPPPPSLCVDPPPQPGTGVARSSTSGQDATQHVGPFGCDQLVEIVGFAESYTKGTGSVDVLIYLDGSDSPCSTDTSAGSQTIIATTRCKVRLQAGKTLMARVHHTNHNADVRRTRIEIHY